jgi:hypothetical protein
MNYSIIEDCSPYFIRFKWEGLEELINFFKFFPYPEKNNFGFRHIRISEEHSQKILKLIPMSNQLEINPYRVSMFLTEPGMYYGAHKDGPNARFSLNIPIKILDNTCVTSWYDESELSNYNITTSILPSLKVKAPPYSQSREILNWDKSKHTPVKSMTAAIGEAILFNTEIFHDWDNSQSSNRRVILTLRHSNPANVYFEDARKILFGI